MTASMDNLELALLDFQEEYDADPEMACELVERLLTSPQAVSYRIAWNDVRRRKAEMHFPELRFLGHEFGHDIEHIVVGVYSAISSGAIAPQRIDQLLNDASAIRRAHQLMAARANSVTVNDKAQRVFQPILHSIMEAVRALLPNELPLWEPRLTEWNLALPDLLGIVDAEDSFDLQNPAGIIFTSVTGAHPLAWRLPNLKGQEEAYLHPMTPSAEAAIDAEVVNLERKGEHWLFVVNAPKLNDSFQPLRYLASNDKEAGRYSTRWAEFVDVRHARNAPIGKIRKTEPLRNAVDLASRECHAEAWGSCLENTNLTVLHDRIRVALNVYDLFHRQCEKSREVFGDLQRAHEVQANHPATQFAFLRRGDLERLTTRRIDERKADVLGRFPAEPGFGGWGKVDNSRPDKSHSSKP